MSRYKAIIEKERQRGNQVEEDYQRKIESLQNEIRELNHKREIEQMQIKQ